MKSVVVSAALICIAVLAAFVFVSRPFAPREEGLRSALSELSEPVTQPQDEAERTRSMAAFRALPRAKPCREKRILILYNTTGPWGYLGELYAIFTANLAGRWASYDAMPVSNYRSGDVARHEATVYLGTSFDEVIPPALIKDIGSSGRPLIWVQYGLGRLAAAMPRFEKRYGLHTGRIEQGGFDHVDYRGAPFEWLEGREAELAPAVISDRKKASVLASAIRTDGSSVPWAVRSENLTFIASNPFSTTSPRGRYLIFADLLARILAPDVLPQRRALVRIEDVGPDARPSDLKKIADYLHSRNVPFSVGVYDTFLDPKRSSPSQPEKLALDHAPEVIEALRYMVEKGGTLIMHGHTHQLGAMANPYSGKSAADFEFFRAHVDAANNVILDGPDERDSFAWALDRIDHGLSVWRRAALPRPEIFEFPHYAASAQDYLAAALRFQARYEQSIYYTGTIDASSKRQGIFATQYFPYPVVDVYGQVVLPENMGNYSPQDYNQHAARPSAELLETADRNRVLRDAFASFYFHWYLSLDRLKEIVEPLQKRGWKFVSADSLVAETACPVK